MKVNKERRHVNELDLSNLLFLDNEIEWKKDILSCMTKVKTFKYRFDTLKDEH